MTSYIITNVKVSDEGDFNLSVLFSYKDKEVQTSILPRTLDKAGVETAIVTAIELFDNSRADNNYTEILNEFDGKITLTVGSK